MRNIRTVSIIRTVSKIFKMFLLYVPYDLKFVSLNNYKTSTYNRKLRVTALSAAKLDESDVSSHAKLRFAEAMHPAQPVLVSHSLDLFWISARHNFP